MPDDKGGRCREGTKKVERLSRAFQLFLYRDDYSRVKLRNYLHNSIDGIPVVHIADKIGNMYSGHNSVGYS